jgi:chemotaxis signal transduction protein
MDNDALLAQLSGQNREEETQATEEEVIYKYLIFSLGESVYALSAEDVREISSENDVYFVPFVPPYVLGYANRHGQPYTVFDLQMLFENVPLEGSTLLILKSETDQVAIRITDVREIVKVPAGKTYRITSDDESARYFRNAFDLNGLDVFVLNVETLLERLERDLG